MGKEDDLAIDFSKIGKKISGLFKSESSSKHKGHKSHSEHAEEKSSDDEISIDVKKAWQFIARHKTVLLMLIPIFFAIFFRAYTFYLPVTDQWAENSVNNYYKSQISAQVNQQYPNLPPENKEAIVNENLQKAISKQGDVYEQQIKQVSENFKSHFQDDSGQTYLLAIDPWQWYRYSGNIVDHGYPGDDIREDGMMVDYHMIAPLGNRVGKELHPYFGAWLFKIIHFFNRDISLLTVFFLLPLIVSALAVIPAFLIGKKIGGDLGGFFAGMLAAVHPAIMTRTMSGFSDTDAYNVFFPLLVFWLFFKALDSKERKSTITYSVLAGLAIAVFASTWYGWWYIFDFVIAAAVIYLLYILIIQKVNFRELFDISKESKKNLVFLALLCFAASSFILIVLFTNFSNFTGALTQPLDFIFIKQATTTLWPNVFTTVAELNEASLSQIISSLGGKLMFAVSILGILLTLTLKKKGRIDTKYAIILVIWFAGTTYASTKGIRFTTLLAPAFAIAIGAAVGISYKYLTEWGSKGLNISRRITGIVLIILMAMLLVGPIKSADAAARNEVPSMNDAWFNALTKIKQNSGEDAIINSWWDFGHWFKAVADRAVTFDGASQNRPQAHWIGKVLLTDNEKEAVGILRMLDCGANLAFDVLYNETNNTHESVDMLYKIVVLEKEEAKKVLEDKYSPSVASKVLKYTHCNPPEDFFIASEDMIGKAGVWAHFGSWNFERAIIWRDLKGLDADSAVDFMVKEFNYTEDDARDLYFETQSIPNEREANNWIAPWPGYVGVVSCPFADNTTLQCMFKIGGQVAPFLVDLDKMEASIETTSGVVRPASLGYMDNKEFVEKKYANSSLPYSIVLIDADDGSYGAVMMSPELAGSMFTRMFYLGGEGLKHFELFGHQLDMSNFDIYTYKVDWEGK